MKRDTPELLAYGPVVLTAIAICYFRRKLVYICADTIERKALLRKVCGKFAWYEYSF